ncbi:LAETG motif-containing sortase-dependent surface protein [Streptomyces sp. NPDC058001]|uniref:LAETG motif-containing sortase-dependent surface protein n=1 Tax=Streptomyces sp. NPDC058001 TaxID=3346300 RepID=UPI0036E39E71
MKLRRAMVAAAATAVIGPLALLSAPAAFATDAPSETPSTSAPESTPESTPPSSPPESSPGTSQPETTPGTTPPSTTPPVSTSPSGDPSSTATTSPEPTGKPTEPSGWCEDDENYKHPLKVGLSGLPGKIVAGSGWHPFTLSVKNSSDVTFEDVIFYAGVGPNDEEAENAFRASQVRLQAKVGGVWEDVVDEEGYSMNFLDLSTIPAGKTLNYQLRLDVRSNAPIGSALTIGGGFYLDEAAQCVGSEQVGYVIEIVKPGTGTDGTKPQEGGKAPIPTEKPNSGNTQKVTGNLAETGSSSALPVIGLVGGIAVVAGAGAVFVVRRRKSDAGVPA